MGSISYAIPYGSSARAEVAKYVKESFVGEFVVGNFAAGDYGGAKYGGWGGYYFGAHRKNDGEVYASVTAFSQYEGDVVIKAMDESVGPNAIGAGSKVLAALSPLPEDAHEWRKDWRERAQNYQAKRKAALKAAREGSIIQLAEPVKLTRGGEINKVKVEGMRLWRTIHGQQIRPFQDWFMSDWSVA